MRRTRSPYLNALIDGRNMTMIGEGGFNRVYLWEGTHQWLPEDAQVDYESWVVKWCMNQDPTDLPERSLRVWKEINPELPAFLIRNAGGKVVGWGAPYLGSEEPSDQEVADCVLSIYRRTRRLVVDAEIDGNFRKYNGVTVCVDVGLAKRCNSPVSQQYWEENKKYFLDSGMYRYGLLQAKPGVNKVVNALLYLESHLSIEKIKIDYLVMPILKLIWQLKRDHIVIDVNILDAYLDLQQHQLLGDDSIIKMVGSCPKFVQALSHVRQLNITINASFIRSLRTNMAIRDCFAHGRHFTATQCDAIGALIMSDYQMNMAILHKLMRDDALCRIFVCMGRRGIKLTPALVSVFSNEHNAQLRQAGLQGLAGDVELEVKPLDSCLDEFEKALVAAGCDERYRLLLNDLKMARNCDQALTLIKSEIQQLRLAPFGRVFSRPTGVSEVWYKRQGNDPYLLQLIKLMVQFEVNQQSEESDCTFDEARVIEHSAFDSYSGATAVRSSV